MFGKRNYFNKNKKIGFKRAISFFIFFIFVVGFIFSAVYVPQILAQGNTDVAGMNQLTKIGLPQQDLVVVIMNIIRVVLGFLGIIGVILVIYAGFVWMTSKGEEEKITKAKKILINATIGLIITLSAFAIVHFVIQSILNKVLETATSSTYSSTTSGNVSFIPSFVVKWVDPKNNETNVFLCRSIQVGFSDKLNVDTINTNNILIKIKDGKKENEICNIKKDCASGKCETNKCIGETVSGSFTVMSDVFRFRAEKDFEENATYQVEITTNVKSEKNRAISSIDSKRRWIFATGSLSDTTPPKVNQVYPENNGTNVCLTTPIQSIFNEPMDVISLMNKDA